MKTISISNSISKNSLAHSVCSIAVSLFIAGCGGGESGNTPTAAGGSAFTDVALVASEPATTSSVAVPAATGITTIDVAGTSVKALPNTAYKASNAGLVTVTLWHW
jgi:hypothetical protein